MEHYTALEWAERRSGVCIHNLLINYGNQNNNFLLRPGVRPEQLPSAITRQIFVVWFMAAWKRRDSGSYCLHFKYCLQLAFQLTPRPNKIQYQHFNYKINNSCVPASSLAPPSCEMFKNTINQRTIVWTRHPLWTMFIRCRNYPHSCPSRSSSILTSINLNIRLVGIVRQTKNLQLSFQIVDGDNLCKRLFSKDPSYSWS